MSTAFRVALTGFTKFERATFESFFRLAAKRNPAYVLAEDPAHCDLVVANAEDEAGVAGIRRQGKIGDTLMLGATRHAGAAQHLPRPINLMLVVRALDTLASARQAEPAEAPPPGASGAQRVLEDLATVTSTIAPGVNPRSLAAAQGQVGAEPIRPPAPRLTDALALLQPLHGEHWSGAPRLDQAPVQPPAPPQGEAPPTPAQSPPAAGGGASERAGMDHILVVDDSDIALRFMATNLQRFGFQVHLARSGADAIDRVARRHFEFVFMDVMMEGLDGFHTCKAIKRTTYPDNRPPPTVVMLTSRGTAVDRLRGTMAGADAYLTKPLREAELLKVVGDREVAKHAYADTADAASTLI